MSIENVCLDICTQLMKYAEETSDESLHDRLVNLKKKYNLDEYKSKCKCLIDNAAFFDKIDNIDTVGMFDTFLLKHIKKNYD